MDVVKAPARRTRREEYAESTRRSLLDIGLRLFLERGYSAVTAEELVRAAGLTRGALYHHFDGKQGLFEAVFVAAEEGAAQRIGAAMAGSDDLWERTIVGLDAFLDVCGDPVYREIVLLQGPIALGWRRWRELDQHHLGGLLVQGVHALRDAGLIGSHPAELTAAALYGALTEISLVTARAAQPAQSVRTSSADRAAQTSPTDRATPAADAEIARRDAMRLVHTLLNALRL